MLVSFDPQNADDRTFVRNILSQMETAPVEAPAQTAPVEAPAQTAPVANGADTTPQPVDPQAGVELDANGSPWLAEVHAGSKTRNKDGSWRAKRGVDKADVASAEAAARAKIAGTPQPVTPEEPVVAPEDMPQATCTVEEVSSMFQQAVAEGKIDMGQYQAIYDSLGIMADQLGVNETMRVKLRDYIVSLYAAPAPVVGNGLPGM